MDYILEVTHIHRGKNKNQKIGQKNLKIDLKKISLDEVINGITI